MTKGFMSDREKALEESYFRQQDARLLEKLRKGATLDEIALALRDKLDVDNPELLARAREAGVTPKTAPVFLLAPLIQVAWAEGKVGRHEREAVLRDHAALAAFLTWLRLGYQSYRSVDRTHVPLRRSSGPPPDAAGHHD